jgi:hypothetical protein
MSMPSARRNLFSAFLTDAALGGGRLFYLGANDAEIVRGGNDGEENDQNAGQGNQTLQGSESPSGGTK